MNDFKLYFQTGWEHIVSREAIDHILFILALGAVYTLRRWKPVLVLVTAFTIGHSFTLVLSVLDVVRFSSKWVEFLIPVTIIITSVFNLLRPAEGNYKVNYVMALLFGLIHGMGFANTIRFMLAQDQQIAIPLLAFNLGLEAGQILIVVMLLTLQWLIVQRTGLNRKVWIRIISLFTLIWGTWMAWARWP